MIFEWICLKLPRSVPRLLPFVNNVLQRVASFREFMGDIPLYGVQSVSLCSLLASYAYQFLLSRNMNELHSVQDNLTLSAAEGKDTLPSLSETVQQLCIRVLQLCLPEAVYVKKAQL